MNEELIAEARHGEARASGLVELIANLRNALSAAEARAVEAEQWRDAMINKNHDLQQALDASFANYGSITRERHDAIERAETAERQLAAARGAIPRLRETAAYLATTRVQGWANPLVANIMDMVNLLDPPEPTDELEAALADAPAPKGEQPHE